MITIKPNDKTGGCSILNTTDYIKALELLLYDTYLDENSNRKPYYESDISEATLKLHLLEVKDLIQEGVNEGVIHKDDVPFMMPSKPTAGRLYGLVKDHAPQSKWLFDKIPPLRPVVSMSGSNTEGLSHWVDEQAKAEVHKLPSYVEDTRHLLQIFQETNETKRQPAHAIPVVMDITNMYGNIPWEDGNIAFQEAMDQREDLSIPTSFIMKVLSVVLSRNVFEFLGKLFIQLFGVAMGSRVAPTYACIFMG